MPLDATLKLRPGLPSDVSAMVEISLDAFSGNTIGRTFFPRPLLVHTELLDPCAHRGDSRPPRTLPRRDRLLPPKCPIAFAKWIAAVAARDARAAATLRSRSGPRTGTRSSRRCSSGRWRTGTRRSWGSGDIGIWRSSSRGASIRGAVLVA